MNGTEDRRPEHEDVPHRERRGSHHSAVEENLDAIRAWERSYLRARSTAAKLRDWVAATAGSGLVIAGHVVWFAGWLIVNAELVPGVPAFDPFPFPFLTLAVSLEAIFLALFVLASQNRLAEQADKRSHLDLQIDLLAEREMTAVLHLLRDISQHFQVQSTITPDDLRDLMEATNLRSLMSRMDELVQPNGGSSAASSGRKRRRRNASGITSHTQSDR